MGMPVSNTSPCYLSQLLCHQRRQHITIIEESHQLSFIELQLQCDVNQCILLAFFNGAWSCCRLQMTKSCFSCYLGRKLTSPLSALRDRLFEYVSIASIEYHRIHLNQRWIGSMRFISFRFLPISYRGHLLMSHYSGWCLRCRLKDRRCSHRACQASYPESGMFAS